MRIKVYKTLYILFVFFATYFAFIASNTDNPVRLSYSSAQGIYSFVPQGWAFFTRNPKENVVKFYKVENSQLNHINGTTSLSFKDVFGLKRHKRRISEEFSQIMSNIKKECKWQEFRGVEINKASKKTMVCDTVINNFKAPLLENGEYLIYSSRRLPWAWAKSKTDIPYKLRKIHIINEN